jgi:hypothetical protein
VSKRFCWDGEEFDLVSDDDDWTGVECITVEDYFGVMTERLDRTRRYYAVLWVGVHRKRPDFTLDDALQLRANEVARVPSAAPAAPAEPEPEPEPDEAVMLSPTSAASEGSSAPAA